jgi:hypothetical protein
MAEPAISPRLTGFMAFLFFAVLAWLIVDHGASLTARILGRGADPQIFIWFFAWWPFALAHHFSLLHTGLIWQPLGVYTPWVTSVPLLAFIGLPITLLAGPAVTYNLFVIAAPALAAGSAYLLFRYQTGSVAAALIGGYLFGFSSYEMAQDTAALNLAFTMFLPLLLLAILMRLNGGIGRARMVVLAAILLVCQFLVSVEIFAFIFIFGGLAWLLALLYLPARRQALIRLFYDGLWTGPAVALALSPFLLTMLLHSRYLHLPPAWPFYFTTDLMAPILPGEETWLGGKWFGHPNAHMLGDFQEQDGYLGIPLCLVIIRFARARGRNGAGRFLIVLLVALLLASFGPCLWVYGHYTGIPLPWSVFGRPPLLNAALPARFAVFVSLAAAMIAALWIAAPGPMPWRRLALGILACAVILPRPHASAAIPVSSFFRPGRVPQVLGERPRILILPFAINGASTFWQQESGFSFVQTGGYLGFPPSAMQSYPAVAELFAGDKGTPDLADLKAFVIATDTQYIVAGPGAAPAMMALLAQLHWKMQQTDDVMIYTVPRNGAPNG